MTTTPPTPPTTERPFGIKDILAIIIVNWYWFVLSLILGLAIAYVHIQRTMPVYSVSEKIFIKENSQLAQSYSRRTMSYMLDNLGQLTNSSGIINEVEILKSTLISEEVVRNLQLHISYYRQCRFRWDLMYHTQPINATIPIDSLETLPSNITLHLKATNNGINITGSYPPKVTDDDDSPHRRQRINATISALPAAIATDYGDIVLTANGSHRLAPGEKMHIIISSPTLIAQRYAQALDIEQANKYTSIAIVQLDDISPQRAKDYLNALFLTYNNQANEEKNELALRTEAFINERIAKVEAELSNTDGSIEQFKKDNKMIELTLSATETMHNSNEYDERLIDINTQISLVDNLSAYLDNEGNKYEVIPSNIGLTDNNTTQLIANYNRVALDRAALLRTASERNPALLPLTTQLDELSTSIRVAIQQLKESLEIQRKSILSQYNKYQSRITSSPQQQRVMTEIGRQQEVQTALYTMLLQKREENNISLATTVNKGQLIDKAISHGIVRPRKKVIVLTAVILALIIPFTIIYLLRLIRHNFSWREMATILNEYRTSRPRDRQGQST